MKVRAGAYSRLFAKTATHSVLVWSVQTLPLEIYHSRLLCSTSSALILQHCVHVFRRTWNIWNFSVLGVLSVNGEFYRERYDDESTDDVQTLCSTLWSEWKLFRSIWVWARKWLILGIWFCQRVPIILFTPSKKNVCSAEIILRLFTLFKRELEVFPINFIKKPEMICKLTQPKLIGAYNQSI